MRFLALSLIGAVSVAGLSLGANAAPSRIAQRSGQTAESCSAGSSWTPAGYAEHAKWRRAHCPPDETDY